MYLFRFIVFSTFLCVSIPGISQDSPSVNILFIGNSYTYFWNLPQTVDQLADARQIDLSIWQSTAGGASLSDHWNGRKGLQTLSKLSSSTYDIVVIQDHSLGAIEQADSLMHYGKKFGELINQSGAKPYVYVTWSREWDPFMLETITKRYNELAQTINAKIVPVGQAWELARKLRPSIPLYDDDQSHPSALGTYLTACVFYAVITGNTPVGLPNRLTTKDENGEIIYLNIQSKENALFCQKVALEVVGLIDY